MLLRLSLELFSLVFISTVTSPNAVGVDDPMPMHESTAIVPSLRKILPKTSPGSNIIVIPPEFKGNIVLNTSHHYHTHMPPPPPPVKRRFILPRPSPRIVTLASAPPNPNARINFGVQTGSDVTEMFSSNAVQTDAKQLQTAETQTNGNVILTQAMEAAQVPVVSPLQHNSPRVIKLQKRHKPSVTSETQTMTSSGRKRRRGNVREKCDTSVNTDALLAGAQTRALQDVTVEAQTRPLHSVAVQEIQTDSECVTSLPCIEDMARTAESISTQTQDSFLSSHQQPSSTHQQVLGARDCEMQTHLHMHMTVDACNTHDVRSLQAIGLNPHPNTVTSPRGGNPLLTEQPSSFVTSHAASQQVTSLAQASSSTESAFEDAPPMLSSGRDASPSQSLILDVVETSTSLLDDVISDIQTQTMDIGVGDGSVFGVDDDVDDDEFWRNFRLIDSHTQTTDAATPAVDLLMTSHDNMAHQQQQHVEIQASIHHMTSQGAEVMSSDIETQTLFDELTDSHTQTSWSDLMQFMQELQ